MKSKYIVIYGLIMLILGAVTEFTINIDHSKKDQINVNYYKELSRTLNIKDSLLNVWQVSLVQKDSLLKQKFDSLKILNNKKYEKVYNSIDTLSDNELIEFFTNEMAKKNEGWE